MIDYAVYIKKLTDGDERDQNEANNYIKYLDAKVRCAVCYQNERDTLLPECGHLFCSECASNVDRCPICRADIRSQPRSVFSRKYASFV